MAGNIGTELNLALGEFNGVSPYFICQYLILALNIVSAYTHQSAFLNIMSSNGCPFTSL